MQFFLYNIILPYVTHCRYFAGQVLLMTSEVSHAQNIYYQRIIL